MLIGNRIWKTFALPSSEDDCYSNLQHQLNMVVVNVYPGNVGCTLRPGEVDPVGHYRSCQYK